MMTLLNYIILPEHEIIIEYGRGEVTVEMFLQMKRNQFDDIGFNKKYNNIVDFRDTNFDIRTEDIKLFPKFFQENAKHWTSRYVAILTNSPKQVVVAMQFINMMKDSPMRYSTVSTIKAAAEWISFPLRRVNELNAELNTLVKEYYT